MKLTPLAKAFIAVVVLGVIGTTGWWYFRDDLRRWAGGARGVMIR